MNEFAARMTDQCLEWNPRKTRIAAPPTHRFSTTPTSEMRLDGTRCQLDTAPVGGCTLRRTEESSEGRKTSLRCARHFMTL
ncbi:hypothetical protein [Variovorax sp. PDC80]|uniref:hypothetical protein n=1 Tax=Variovorax sp. PDC80 TaxID=1882827 RepID=UPI0015A63CCB|nr:hypothetical protein [Variovorax sp. PDC80]